jgi:hypothetical protein
MPVTLAREAVRTLPAPRTAQRARLRTRCRLPGNGPDARPVREASVLRGTRRHPLRLPHPAQEGHDEDRRQDDRRSRGAVE